jgi:2-dehydro-3-deoxy-D-arabinonate dehydratase
MTDHAFLLQYDGNLCLQVDGTTYRLHDSVASLDKLLSDVPVAELLPRLMEARADEITLGPERLGPPVGNQEIWASGVTYKRSEEARERESHNSTVYTRVYNADRPELGDGDPAGIRADATWSVPEPELVVVFNAQLEVVGFTIGNDMSSRDIEGENPLYLPQAKVYDRSCVIGPRIWLQPGVAAWPEVEIHMTILRGGAEVFTGTTSTGQIKRSLTDLRDYLGYCKRFARGALLFTGTGIVPPDDFSLQPGDEVRIRIDPIGELVNPVVIVGGSGA